MKPKVHASKSQVHVRKSQVHASQRIFYILTLLLLVGVQPALAQFVLRALNTPNGIGVLTGSDFTASVAVGQAVAGTSSNDDFTVGLGALTGAVIPTGIEVAPVGDEVPGNSRLDQNYPHPFNPQTTITFDLKKSGHVSLAVYNALGQQVAVLVSETQPAGRYEVTWDAAGLPSGLYFYQIRAANFHAVRKMMLIK